MPSVGRSAPRQYRATSPDSLRQLYGIPVSQIRTSEDVFRKEAYKRDKQRLKTIVEALNAEKKQVERRWEARKSQFAQQRALLAPSKKRREVVYHKVATLEAQPEEVVPPCIPFVGTFPPFRHSTKPRLLSEMFKEPLFSRSALHTHSAGCSGEKERRKEAGRCEGVLSDGPCSLLPSAASFATPSRSAQTGEAGPRNISVCSSSFQQGQFRNARSVDTTNNRGVYQSYPSGSVDTFGTMMSKQASTNSLRMTLGYTDQKVQLNNKQAADNQLQVMSDGYQNGRSIDCEVNHNWAKHLVNDNHSQINHNKSSQLSTNIVKTKSNKYGLANGNNTSLRKGSTKNASVQKFAPSVLDSRRLVEQMAAPDRANEPQQLITDHIQAATEREGEETSGDEDLCSMRSDLASTPDSMDIDLLQQALVDHASHNLNRNRWQRSTEHTRISAHGAVGEDTPFLPPLLHSTDTHHGSDRSLPSVSTPTTRSAADASDVAADSGMAVVQIIMQLFRELDHPQLSSLADMWPRKMEKMMSAIGDLVRDTGVDVTEIVEKIQRGDVQDEKSAALLDWISNIEATVPAGTHGESGLIINQDASKTRLSVSINNDMGRGHFVEDIKGNIGLDEPTRVGSRRPSALLTKGPAGKRRGGQQTTQSGVAPNGHQPVIENAGREHPHLGTSVNQPGKTTADTSLSSRTRTVEYRRKSQSASSACRASYNATDAANLCQVRRASILRGHSAVTVSQSKPAGISSSCSITSKSEDESPTKLSNFSAHSLSHPYSGLSSIKRMTRRDSTEKKGEHFLPCVDQACPLVFITGDSQPASSSPEYSPGMAVSPTPVSKTSRSSSQVQTMMADENGSPQNGHQIKQTRSENASSAFTVERQCGCEKDLKKITEQQGNGRTRFRASSLSRFPGSTDDPVSPTYSASRRASSTAQETVHTSAKHRPRAKQFAAMAQGRTVDNRSMEIAQNENLSVTPFSHNGQGTVDNPGAWSEEQEQTTETLLHTDRRGRMHRLTMRKVSLNDTCSREANVTFTRDDHPLETGPICNANDNDDREDASASQAEKGENSFSGIGETKQDEQLPPSISPAADSLRTAPPPPEVSPNDMHDEDEKDLGEKASEERADENAKEEDYEGLWRRRLAHSRHMSWVQELTTDHRAQGLALSLLLRKKGGGPKFRSMALKVICINALRAAKHVHEDQAYRDLKNCRYLRMPEEYLPDIQRELDLHDIFA